MSVGEQCIERAEAGLGSHRLHKMTVESCGKSFRVIALLAVASDRNKTRQRGAIDSAELAHQGVAVHPGKADVEQCDIESAALGHTKSIDQRVGPLDAVSHLLELTVRTGPRVAFAHGRPLSGIRRSNVQTELGYVAGLVGQHAR